MEKAREIVSSILKERQIDTIYFVGCGGSLAGFFPAKYFISCEARKVKVEMCIRDRLISEPLATTRLGSMCIPW